MIVWTAITSADPDQDRRHQQQAPDQEERPKLQADLPLDQERRSPRPGPRPATIASATATMATTFAQEERARADRRGIGDRRQPGRSFPLERLDRVEQEEQAEARGQGSHRADGEGPGVIKSGVSRKPTATSAVPIVWSRIKGMNR